MYVYIEGDLFDILGEPLYVGATFINESVAYGCMDPMANEP